MVGVWVETLDYWMAELRAALMAEQMAGMMVAQKAGVKVE